MDDDADLLRKFAQEHDDACFRQLVERRIGFVYAVSLRRLRDSHLAHDATQAVFIALARKAAGVAARPSVMGWLHRSACYESRNLLRSQVNRAAREREAQRRGTAGAEAIRGPAGLDAAEALLDDALAELAAVDREAILARFFANRSYAEIGAASGRTENAARMRVDRALVQLRDRLRRRGFDSTAAVLAAALPGYASAAVPQGLAVSVANAALATGAATAIPATLLTFFATMNAAKISATLGALAGLGFIGYQVHQTQALQKELRDLRQQHAQSMRQAQTLEQQLEELKARTAASAVATSTVAAAVTPTAVKAESADVPGITRKAPAGWFKNGNNPDAYDVGVDQTQTWGGMPSAYAKSKAASGVSGFGGMMQTTAADQYRGKRVRLSGWMKTQDANDGGGHLWLRIDGRERGRMLGFDNMNKRAPKGTTEWQEYAVVLDVPPEATSLNYGFFIQGSGQMWVNALTIQPVGSDVPTTNMLDSAAQQLPTTPVNLGFSPH